MTITFGKLGDQLFDACGRHRNQPLFIALFELYFLVERLLKRGFQIQRDWSLLAFGALRVAALPGFELIFSGRAADRKSTRLNSSHLGISYAVFCLKKKKNRE